MMRMAGWALVVAAGVALVVGGEASTALVTAEAGAHGGKLKPVVGPVEMKAQPAHVGGYVAAFPLVLAGPAVSQAAADRINASLRREQATADAAARKCRSDYREETHRKAAPDAWTRSVEVTFKGPHYVGFVAADTYFCGGAYPDEGNLPLVYDLTTGAPVNWVKLFPAGAHAERGNAVDGSVLGAIVWPELSRRAEAGSKGDCENAYDSGSSIPWAISLDAREGKLQANAYEVAHAIRGCEDVEVFSPAQMRKMGFAAELADAVEAAHALQR